MNISRNFAGVPENSDIILRYSMYRRFLSGGDTRIQKLDFFCCQRQKENQSDYSRTDGPAAAIEGTRGPGAVPARSRQGWPHCSGAAAQTPERKKRSCSTVGARSHGSAEYRVHGGEEQCNVA